jgi:glutamate-5-semialdehyde dehydrogenase
VVKHDKGICNLYVDQWADPMAALDVAINAKLQRPSVCNAIENLVIHSSYPQARDLLQGLMDAGVDLLGCDKTLKIFDGARPIEDPEQEYSTEYLDQRLSVKVVEGLDEAIDFIHKYNSGHSEAIISKDQPSIDRFLSSLDSAALFVNCSTRFHDGGQMGMGAEVGISTGRLHVRGPMGVRDLTTTTYVLQGSGQVRE